MPNKWLRWWIFVFQKYGKPFIKILFNCLSITWSHYIDIRNWYEMLISFFLPNAFGFLYFIYSFVSFQAASNYWRPLTPAFFLQKRRNHFSPISFSSYSFSLFNFTYFNTHMYSHYSSNFCWVLCVVANLLSILTCLILVSMAAFRANLFVRLIQNTASPAFF